MNNWNVTTNSRKTPRCQIPRKLVYGLQSYYTRTDRHAYAISTGVHKCWAPHRRGYWIL
jgi:hypothetical protein